jgi:hypothetical protein
MARVLAAAEARDASLQATALRRNLAPIGEGSSGIDGQRSASIKFRFICATRSSFVVLVCLTASRGALLSRNMSTWIAAIDMSAATIALAALSHLAASVAG